MAKHKKKHKHGKHGNGGTRSSIATPDGADRPKRLKRKPYERELKQLQVELVHLQQWVVDTGARVCIVFEGRDTAGKGGVIKRLTERVSPRVFRTVALPAPNEREKSQMYTQRYMAHFPAGGEIVIFDRSWYNRAGVERVMGFATEQEVERFLELVPAVEKVMVESGIILLKYWLEVDQDEQTRRLRARIEDGRKTWKLPGVVLALVRLLARSRRHVRRYRYRRRPVVRRRLQRQAQGAPQHHQPPAQPDPLRAKRAGAGRAARAGGPW